MDATFGDYARYYNLLYRDKDYAGEVDFIAEALARAGNRPKSLLDLGCGTGRHALELARRGMAVTGVDRSEEMLLLGRQSLSAAGPLPTGTAVPQFVGADVRAVRLGRRFEAVTSLFHVLSYQLTEEDALALLITAREHLAPGGHFLFDFWHGLGVLSDPPARREKVMEDTAIQVRREAVPTMHPLDDTVDVTYHVTMTDKTTGRISRLSETHRMRYWFLPELRYLARQAGFMPMEEGAWSCFAPPTCATWYAWMLLTA
ncbi:methyltransferase domain-containing protein [Desulfovibrio aerotolerans]|uniref:Methyltransferase domain-containing protein n=1 Tax=Solidesulfovibrio aerotolerans TaxID=295255 RepID=A0A7C9IMZ5_9BACT|nr:class I SAM-dependent methyltransferase [Solidesulfovibrio aerotolerans]MYL84645.1 methyltransferase domain-containing protein [Solidesulfovibrio aerotolerans]